MTFAWLVILVMPAFVLVAVARNQRNRSVARSVTVEVRADDEGVTRHLVDGRVEHVAWDEVTEVDIFTTRKGPHRQAGGAVVLYGDAERGCIVPLDQLATSALLDHLWRLPSFDLAPLIKAINADPHALDASAGHRSALGPTPIQRTTVLWLRDPVT